MGFGLKGFRLEKLGDFGDFGQFEMDLVNFSRFFSAIYSSATLSLLFLLRSKEETLNWVVLLHFDDYTSRVKFL